MWNHSEAEGNNLLEMSNEDIIKWIHSREESISYFFRMSPLNKAALWELRQRYDGWTLELSEISHIALRNLVDDLRLNEFSRFEKKHGLEKRSLSTRLFGGYGNRNYRTARDQKTGEAILISEAWEKRFWWLWIDRFINPFSQIFEWMHIVMRKSERVLINDKTKEIIFEWEWLQNIINWAKAYVTVVDQVEYYTARDSWWYSVFASLSNGGKILFKWEKLSSLTDNSWYTQSREIERVTYYTATDNTGKNIWISSDWSRQDRKEREG